MNKMICAALISMSPFAYSNASHDQSPEGVVHQSFSPITQELIAMVHDNPEFKDLLEKSIRKAKSVNPDRKTNPAQSLEEYYDFVEWGTQALPWNVLKDQDSPILYNQIDQSLDYFYFLVDQPLEELDGKGLERNTLQYVEPYRSWLIKYVKEWGEFLSKEASWKDDYYQFAYNDDNFGLNKGWYEDHTNWKSFNQFFSRQLKSPDQRPIYKRNDPSWVVSPADSVPQGVWRIDQDARLLDKDGVRIKSSTFRTIDQLLDGSEYSRDFANGVLTHVFLDVHDYHRYHFPVGGKVLEKRVISQDDAVGGVMTWNRESKRYMLDAETPGWQFIETRGYVILDTDDYGLVALIPVGMSQVSSVNFEPEVQVGAQFQKGDKLGYFLFGGSDFIMLFQKEAQFQMKATTKDKKHFEHILMGQKYGALKTK